MNQQTSYQAGLRKSFDIKYIWKTMPADVYPLVGAISFACVAALTVSWYGYTRDVSVNLDKRKEQSRPMLSEPSFRYVTLRKQEEQGKH